MAPVFLQSLQKFCLNSFTAPRDFRQKNAHIFSNVCQVYKGEIEEKLLSRYCKPLNGHNYLAEPISGQALPSFFAITALFLSKNIRKRKNKQNRILFFSISIKRYSKQKNAHIFSNVCQVYKGEIEEKLVKPQSAT